jgi:hypothetical protein
MANEPPPTLPRSEQGRRSIGPSFPDELKAAGCTTDGYAWSSDGNITFTDVSEEEREKILAVLAAHDGPLSEARHQALEATDAEASRRIADLFGKPPETLKLAWKQINALGKAVQILNKKIEGTALPEERLTLEVLDEKYTEAEAVRDAEGKAKALLLGARSVEEVDQVTPAWPKE